MTKKILAWHFVADTLRDGRPAPADGELLVHPGEPAICQSGLHASRSAYDALQHAPGGTLCLVECGGTVIEQSDKLVCTERTILARMDAVPLLRYFAQQQALSVIHLWQMEPDQAVLDYLMGDSAARSAAGSAAESAARSAARSAAWSARSAAWSAALSAARSAAESAAWSAARSAAWSAAESAAWSAARSAAEKLFDSLVAECFEDFLPRAAFAPTSPYARRSRRTS